MCLLLATPLMFLQGKSGRSRLRVRATCSAAASLYCIQCRWRDAAASQSSSEVLGSSVLMLHWLCQCTASGNVSTGVWTASANKRTSE